jgi:hypothetical protein
VGKIVILWPTAETQELLTQYADFWGFDLSKSFSGNELSPGEFDFHITVTAGDLREGETLENGTHALNFPLKASPTHIGTIGEHTTPCLFFMRTGPLDELRRLFDDKITSTFPNWIVHSSLSYAEGATVPRDIELPSFPIVFDRYEVQDFEIKEDVIKSFSDFLKEDFWVSADELEQYNGVTYHSFVRKVS